MLEQTITEHDNNREGRLKDLEKKIKAVKAKMQSAAKDLKVKLLPMMMVNVVCEIGSFMNSKVDSLGETGQF